tara:strand:- start:400 stop:513 length:114 start_codon:yes stop_codon:yes gene_type:complete
MDQAVKAKEQLSRETLLRRNPKMQLLEQDSLATLTEW